MFLLQITDLPFSLYSTFVVEARHGFNKVCMCNQTSLSCCISNKFLVTRALLLDSINLTTAVLPLLLSVLLLPLPLLYYYFLGSSSVYFLISCCFLYCYLFVFQQTIWLFFRDMVKGICLAVILGPPIVSAIIVIVQVKPYLSIFVSTFLFAVLGSALSFKYFNFKLCAL